ncbi:hypothetical protein B0T26DRAFT_812205 [Lasiosphaeria miniovina]|uniref:Isochorismatase-like domain-containing protein n=1 Tax=Lasiosphaeria miniovina TaxID=1954250 RepID=A0AA40AK11_9PEZI|nr:uncharacterized protein B0T26DRAFT_812205 [Lasiosphaeria miniovina]KAK0717293.1 hypothetical protein B0T26DRAFT_812205 [Lasiosphaeria miniovina]
MRALIARLAPSPISPASSRQDARNNVIGSSKIFWLWSKNDGFDPTHPPTTDSPCILPRISLATTKENATIDPAKTALVVDLQNYFISPLLGRPRDSLGLKVVDRLLDTVIPACRKAEIPKDVEEMPPSIARGYQFGLDSNFEDGGSRDLGALGDNMGKLKLEDGTEIEAGRVMTRHQWNTAFYPALMESAEPQDMRFHKNRLSGTLPFVGGNTDQCFQSTMQDAYAKGWDVLTLSDGCSTKSLEFATKCIEYNCEN